MCHSALLLSLNLQEELVKSCSLFLTMLEELSELVRAWGRVSKERSSLCLGHSDESNESNQLRPDML